MSHIRNSLPKNYNSVIISPYWGTIPLTINPQNKPDNLISRHEQQLVSDRNESIPGQDQASGVQLYWVMATAQALLI